MLFISVVILKKYRSGKILGRGWKMKTIFTEIEELIFEKVMLFSDLVDILKQERQSVQEIDLDALWKFSSMKQEKATKIEAVRNRLLECLESLGIIHDMNKNTFNISTVFALLPQESLKNLSGVNAKLILLRQEVHQFAAENKAHVKNGLAAVNDMVRIITKDTSSPNVYSRNINRNNSRKNLFIHREV